MSEKPMTELLRKTGLFDKYMAEFKKWRLVDPPLEEEKKEEQEEILLEDLVEDIAKVLEEEPTMKQTLLTPARRHPEIWVNQETGFDFYAVQDEMGRLLTCSSGIQVSRGDTILRQRKRKEADAYVVTEVEDIYEGDEVVSRLLTIEKED